MIIKNAEHEITAVKPNQYPVTGFPEVAFVGRSNVGKSSIINTLLNRKNLARVGQTPGKTRQINFYNVNNNFYLVDLPGYGFANVSKDMKASWENIIERYLYTRKQNHLKLVIMLVDIRHSPSKDDIVMHQWIKGFGMNALIVATKSDKISRSQTNVRINDIRKVLQLDKSTKVIPFSSENRTGKDEVLNEIEKSLFMDETSVELPEAVKDEETGGQNRADKTDRLGKTDKIDKPDKSSKTGKTDKAVKSGKTDKKNKAGKTNKEDKSDKVAHSAESATKSKISQLEEAEELDELVELDKLEETVELDELEKLDESEDLEDTEASAELAEPAE